MDLVDAAAAWHRSELTGLELLITLSQATVFCQARDEPGLMAWGAPGAGAIGVFSDLAELAVVCGAVKWLSLPGSELLQLWPAGYDMLIDPRAEHATRLPYRWLALTAGAA